MAIPRLAKRLADVEAFDPNTVTGSDPESAVRPLSASIDDALARTFGNDTLEYRRYSPAFHFNWPQSYLYETSLHEIRSSLSECRQRALDFLGEAISSLEERLAESKMSLEKPPSSAGLSFQSRRAFIVHGHDEGARESVARFLEKIGFEAVILHEQPNLGRTIITKFREEAEGIGFAVVLMTPDDYGGPAGSATNPRARQNVVFELGYFIGALGPERVAALVKGKVERPSDFDGVVYISLDNGSWRADLGREIEAAGFDIDWNKVMRP